MLVTSDWNLAMDTVDFMSEQGVLCKVEYAPPNICTRTGKSTVKYLVTDCKTGLPIRILEV